jgi:hypothetical protein
MQQETPEGAGLLCGDQVVVAGIGVDDAAAAGPSRHSRPPL